MNPGSGLTPLKMLGLGLHFFLELAALAAMGVWGFQTHADLGSKLLFGLGLPVLAAALWGVFRVPNDPTPAVVITPGPLRLLLEWAVMGGAVLALSAAGHPTLALIFAAAVVVDYLIMYQRVGRLLFGR